MMILDSRFRAAVDAFGRDLRYALRSLWRRPLTSTAAIATLAIGIGLNAAVFSVVDWVLLRPLPYPSPEELVRVSIAGTAPVTGPTDLTYAEFLTLSQATALRASTAFATDTRVLGGSGVEPSHVVVARLSGDLFRTLGVEPEVGRALSTEEIAAGTAVMVLSHGLWQRRCHGDREIAGRVITIDGAPHAVVSVMPAGRGYPNDADLWRPLTAAEHEDDDRDYGMLARLRGDTSIAGERRARGDGAHRVERRPDCLGRRHPAHGGP